MRSEPVHHFLCDDFRVIIVVIAHLGIHVVDRADRQKVKLADRKTDLYAPQKKERGDHFLLCRLLFF